MSILLRHKNSIYQLNETLSQVGTDIDGVTSDRETSLGDLSTLETAAKGNLVKAINEALTNAGDQGAETLKKVDNLSDLTDVAAARQNLSIMVDTAFDDKVDVAKLALGTNHSVANIAERDAKTDLNVNDRVYVADQGDGTWGIFRPAAVDPESGDVTDWLLISDETQLDNTLSKADIRAAYVSNPDTNPFLDADQAKVGHLTVTKAVDLDDLSVKEDLIQDLIGNDAVDAVASTKAIKAYIDGVASIGGVVPKVEKVKVVGDKIELSYPPAGGRTGICNFGNVRYTDANDVSYDAPVVATVDSKKFQIATDDATQWDGFDVTVQYFHYLDMRDYVEQPVPPEAPEGELDQGGIVGEATDQNDDGFLDQGVLEEPAP